MKLLKAFLEFDYFLTAFQVNITTTKRWFASNKTKRGNFPTLNVGMSSANFFY